MSTFDDADVAYYNEELGLHKRPSKIIDLSSREKKIIESFSNIEKSNKAKKTFDKWKRPEGGGGQTFVIESGAFFDNCAVNFSSISGKKHLIMDIRQWDFL